MKDYSGFKHNPVYFTGYFILIFILAAFCSIFGKSEGFLFINHFHSSLTDSFFILFTNLGSGFLVIGILIFLLFLKKFGWALQIGSSFLISGLLVQIIKRSTNFPRPKEFFGPNAIHCINGITRIGYSSFPSGHTATIFAVTTLFAFYYNDRRMSIFLLIISVMTGFSRIYLSQHFPVDVLVGSMVGVITSVVVYKLFPLALFEKKVVKDSWGEQTAKLQ